MIYTDAHCHLGELVNAPEIACRIYNATRPADWANSIQIAETDDDENFASVGIHPWYIDDAVPDWESAICEILSTHPNIMVGEVGLDKFHPNMPHQIEIFTAQLQIAARTRRPLHLHCVGAWDKILHIFRAHTGTMPPAIVAHAFSGDPANIPMLADKYNMYFSYSAAKNDKDTARIIATPQNRILVESDTFDSPDEISILDSALNNIAALRGCAPDEMSNQIYNNINGVLSYVRPIA